MRQILESAPLSYIIYNESGFLLDQVLAAGTIACDQLIVHTSTSEGKLILAGIDPLDFAREAVQNESERLRRTSPLQTIRLLRERCAQKGAHLFCALSYEAAHIFDDLELPKEPFASFIIARVTAFKTRDLKEELDVVYQSNGAQFPLKYELIADSSSKFSEMFDKAKEHIRIGDIFEIVLSRAFDFQAHAITSTSNPYNQLSKEVLHFKAPYRFALNFPVTKLVGASPELLVHVKDGIVTTRPISGSMRRNTTVGSQAELTQEELLNLKSLYASEKEKSELDMLVDLARHDLHRVCNQVEVSSYREALVLETVIHTQSTVTGHLFPQFDALDAVFSCLNAGTLVGAPKKKAMEIIAKLEGTPRRFYGGNLIHALPDGSVLATILIRTFQITENAIGNGQFQNVHLQAGATVLHESRNDYEFWECGTKAKSLLELVGFGNLAEGIGLPPAIDTSSDPSMAHFRYLKGFSSLTSKSDLNKGTDHQIGKGIKLVLIDNHDSFTFNLAALFQYFGCSVEVIRNDKPIPSPDSFDALILSPGPSSPIDAGNLIALTTCLWNIKPIFGVCLGFQAMVAAQGGKLEVMNKPVHGKARFVKKIAESPFLSGLPHEFIVARYHSLFAEVVPSNIDITLVDDLNRPMALESTNGTPPHFGVQFHPESFMSAEYGVTIARNWLHKVREFLQTDNSLKEDYEQKASALYDAILNREPSQDFLAQSLQNGLDSQTLAKLILKLRRISKVPSGLTTVCKQMAKSAELFEVCGTGGTNPHRLNTSTLTALFAAATGLRVVKHGGRSASGHKGSLDLLESLELSPLKLFENSAENLRVEGVAFLGATLTYSAFARYASLRKELKNPTLFNLLGPMLNPILPTYRLLGTFDKLTFQLVAETLVQLNESGVVVLGIDSLGYIDEVHPRGTTWIAQVHNQKITYKILSPLQTSAGLVPPLLARTAIFTDPLSAAFDVLQCKESPSGVLGLEFVLANLSILQIIDKKLEINQKNFQLVFDSLFLRAKQIAFRTRCLIETLKKSVPTHPRSPLASETPFATEKSTNHFQSEKKSANFNLTELGPLARRLYLQKENLVIAEIKIRTPKIEFQQTLTLEERIKAYQDGGANALSVVVHSDFDGSIELLRKVRSLTDLPLLAKDFIKTAAAIEAIAEAGANAVLILEDWLGTAKSFELAQIALKYGMLPVIESTHSIPFENVYPCTLPKSSNTFPYLPLLNSRNLFTLKTSTQYRQEVAKHNPQVVLASEIATVLDGRLALRQNRGILIGESLMRLQNKTEIKKHLLDLRNQNLLFKACGAQSLADILGAMLHGADLVGINLIPESKRYIDPEKLRKIRDALLKRSEHSEENFSVWDSLCFLTSDSTPEETIQLLCRLESQIKLQITEQIYSVCKIAQTKFPNSLTAPNEATKLYEATQKTRILQPYSSCFDSFYGDRFLLLDGPNAGSGNETQYPDCPPSLFHVPTLVAGGVTPENALVKVELARSCGWNVVGIDCASGIAMSGNENSQGVGFEFAKIAKIRLALNHSKA